MKLSIALFTWDLSPSLLSPKAPIPHPRVLTIYSCLPHIGLIEGFTKSEDISSAIHMGFVAFFVVPKGEKGMGRQIPSYAGVI